MTASFSTTISYIILTSSTLTPLTTFQYIYIYSTTTATTIYNDKQASALGSFIGEAVGGVFGLLVLLAIVFFFIRRARTSTVTYPHRLPIQTTILLPTADTTWSEGNYDIPGTVDSKKRAWAPEDYAITSSVGAINFPNAAYANSTTEISTAAYYSQITEPAATYHLGLQSEVKSKDSEYFDCTHYRLVSDSVQLSPSSTSVYTNPIYAAFDERNNTPTCRLASAENDVDL